MKEGDPSPVWGFHGAVLGTSYLGLTPGGLPCYNRCAPAVCRAILHDSNLFRPEEIETLWDENVSVPINTGTSKWIIDIAIDEKHMAYKVIVWDTNDGKFICHRTQWMEDDDFGWARDGVLLAEEHTNRERETEFEKAREHMDLKPRL